jgi:RES domain-containing protein
MKPAGELPGTLLRVSLKPLEGFYPRRVPIGPLLGLKGPFSAGDTATIKIPQFLRPSVSAGRFNVPGIKALYAAEDEATAEGEVYQHPGLAAVKSERPPDVVYQIEVKLQAILDLTEMGTIFEIDTNPAELVAAWRPLTPAAPTQILGQAAYDCGRIEGILYYSAPAALKAFGKKCLVVFPDRLKSGSRVTLIDPFGVFKEQIALT